MNATFPISANRTTTEMNVIYLSHRAEQMEAMRRDFAILWVKELLPKLGTSDPRKIGAAQHEAWMKFLKNKQSLDAPSASV